jgi:hypothetical protein
MRKFSIYLHECIRNVCRYIYNSEKENHTEDNNSIQAEEKKYRLLFLFRFIFICRHV